MTGAGAKDRAEGLIHGGPRRQRKRGRLAAGIALPAGEDVAALGLARGLDAERRRGLQRHGECVECARRSLDQLELQLRDPVPPALRPDLAAVECDLDQRGAAIRCAHLDRRGAAHDIGRECRRQLRRPERPHGIAHRPVRGDGQRGHRGLHRARPLVAPEHGAGAARPVRLQGLDQPLAVFADAQREAAPAQAEVAGIEIGAAQALLARAAACGDRRTPALVEGGRIAAERQLDLERVPVPSSAPCRVRHPAALSLVHRSPFPVSLAGCASGRVLDNDSHDTCVEWSRLGRSGINRTRLRRALSAAAA